MSNKALMFPSPKQQSASTSGFSLIELLVVVLMLGVLAAIAAPGWLTILNRQRVAQVQNAALDAIRESQANADRSSRSWITCFRTSNGRTQVLTQPVPDVIPVGYQGCNATDPGWRDLGGEAAGQVIIASQTNLALRSGFPSVRFRHNGIVTSANSSGGSMLGRIVFTPKDQTAPKRCVFVSTILGATRIASGEATTAQGGCNP